MKHTFTCAVLLCLTAAHVNAELLPIKQVISPIQGVTNTIRPIGHQVDDALPLKPFELSKLLDVSETITTPLMTLPDTLPLSDVTGQLINEVKLADGSRAIEREWVMLSDKDAINILLKYGALISQQKSYPALDLHLVTFTVPSHLDSKSALNSLLPQDITRTLDRNHVFQNQNEGSRTLEQDADPQHSPMCLDELNIGMVDTAIQQDHPAFAHSKITSRYLVDFNNVAPVNHGTAIAGTLVGKGQYFSPLLPNATLFSAAVFYKQSDYAQGATMLNIVDGLNWLAEKGVKVINMSLAGPHNDVLALVINTLVEAGTVVVAAAGNEGPAAAPIYPAAYKQVIAVTAIDRQHHIYRWANQGEYIDFAALGVKVYTAHAKGGEGRETGTSMASPVVAALAACLLAKQDQTDIRQTLKTHSLDLGKQGKDPIFGYGLLQRPTPSR
ncbi:S8 family serine peptidase [Flavobacterium sp. W21_SRS_FM6]|uniref:S8 family serine peptidase n=1 Tax=Flavobacterium sp. W21_SRS_FM6 TaxID=3240268 RepID=UPI003F936723